MQGLPCKFADDLEVHRCVYYYPHMVRVVTWFLVGVIDGVHDDCQCLQFPVRGGSEDGSPCEVVLVQSACRIRFQWILRYHMKTPRKDSMMYEV